MKQQFQLPARITLDFSLTQQLHPRIRVVLTSEHEQLHKAIESPTIIPDDPDSLGQAWFSIRDQLGQALTFPFMPESLKHTYFRVPNEDGTIHCTL